MISPARTSVRDRLVARTRLYLAAVITGGVAAGVGLTAAAAHADAAHTGSRSDDTPAPVSHSGRHTQRHTHSSTQPVRPAPQAPQTQTQTQQTQSQQTQSQQTQSQQTQSQPAPQGRTHSS